MTEHTAAVAHTLAQIRTDSALGLFPNGSHIDSLCEAAEYVDANTYLLDTAEALGLADDWDSLAELATAVDVQLAETPILTA